MPFTFGQLKTRIREEIFPDGEAINTVRTHDRQFLAAMVELQRSVESLQKSQITFYPFCTTFYQCGMTVFDRVQGHVKRVFTITDEDDCDEVDYTFESDYRTFIDYSGSTDATTAPDQHDLASVGRRILYAGEEQAKTRGRAIIGRFTIHNHRIILAPRIDPEETIVVEWHGVRQNWKDDDLLPIWWLDERQELPLVSIQKAIGQYVLWMSPETCKEDKAFARAEFLLERKNLMDDEWVNSRADHNESTRIKPCRTVRPTDEEDEEEETSEEITFAFTADMVEPDNGQFPQEVFDLVDGWAPEFVLGGGDLLYADASDDQVDYENEFDQIWGSYVTNSVDTTRFWPALGNHDYNDAGLAAWNNYFPTPGDRRYYEIIKGPCSIFVLDSDPNEADGNSQSSKQGEWLRVRLSVCKSRWKIVVCQDCPYTSGPDRPGNVWMRWPFKSWGANMVLSGDTHAYERYDVDGIPFIVSGTGGAVLIESFGGYIDSIPEKVTTRARLLGTYGAVQLTADCDHLTARFYGIDQVLYDTVALTQDEDGNITTVSTPADDIAAPAAGLLSEEGGVFGEGDTIFIP